MRTRRPWPALLVTVLTATLAVSLPVTGASAAQPGAAWSGAGRAARPGQWSEVTSKLTNIADIGLARGRDGVLHVLWTSGNTGSYRVSDTPVSGSGVVGKPVTVQAHIYSANDPDATAIPSGLAVFWNAVRSNSPTSQVGTFEADRPSRAGSWTIGPVTPTSDSWLSSEAAAPGSGGHPWVAFGNSGGIVVHHLGQPSQELSFPVCCVYDEGLGSDAKTGTTWLTYLSTVPEHTGLFAQQLTSAGQRAAKPILLPGSGNGDGGLVNEQRINATGLGGNRPGVYVTYRTGGQAVAHHLELYRLGARSPVSLANFTLDDEIGGSTLAADPSGRLWVAWFRVIDNRPLLFVRRAKSQASDFGPVEQVALPKGTANITKVYLNAQARKLDVLALLTLHGKTAYWTTQVLPPKQ